MTRLGDNTWGKSAVRISKLHRGSGEDRFSELTVGILLEGDVDDAYRLGDNTAVLPTDTMRNTVYVIAQEHLDDDLEGFGTTLAAHFLTRESVVSARVEVAERSWFRVTPTGFLGGSSEMRIARVDATEDNHSVKAGIEGLQVLKTTGSAFEGFPRDELTTLPEKDDRVLATTIAADWLYDPLPADTTATWGRIREVLLERFFEDWSASVQHQGWQMGEAVLEAVAEVAEVTFRLPNQHHLSFDFGKVGVEDRGEVFHPVSEPYGDIRFTVVR